MHTPEKCISDILQNKYNKTILDRLPLLNLNDTWLVAGCLFQTIWNLETNRPPEENINDYDVFYFDKDTSFEAEDQQIKNAAELFKDLNIEIQVRNQSRLPIWYQEKFHTPYPRVNSAKDNISRFLFRCNCIGIQPSTSKKPDLYAPYGLDEMYEGILIPNENVMSFSTPDMFENKAKKYLSRWPWLKIVKT